MKKSAVFITQIMTGFILLILLSPSFTHAFGAEYLDGPEARRKITGEVQSLFLQGKYNELEKVANELRITKARFPDGGWKIGRFFDAFSPYNINENELFHKLDTWSRKYPNSINARLAAGSAWIAYAYKARGSGYANTVTENGWRLYRERLAKAYDLIKDDPGIPSADCPYRYDLLLSIALAQGWDRSRYDSLFQKATAFEPSFWGYYLSKAIYLMPRWHGEKGEWQRYADQISQKEGMEIYSRIITLMWLVGEFKTFSEAEISWQKTKQGFLEKERKYPNSPANLNYYCLLACIAGDKETARQLLNRIANAPYVEIWEGRSIYEKWRRWANAE